MPTCLGYQVPLEEYERAFHIHRNTIHDGCWFGKPHRNHAAIGRFVVQDHARLFDVAHSWPIPMQAVRPAPACAVGTTR